MQLEDRDDRTMATDQLSSEEEWETGVGPVGVKDWRAPNHQYDRHRGDGWSKRAIWWILVAFTTALHGASASLITGEGVRGGVGAKEEA